MSYRNQPQGTYHETHTDPEVYNDIQQKSDARKMAERGAEILNRTLDFIVSSKSPQVATWAAANALGAACCEGRSCSDRAAMLNITPQALSKQTREFADAIGIEPVYGYDKH